MEIIHESKEKHAMNTKSKTILKRTLKTTILTILYMFIAVLVIFASFMNIFKNPSQEAESMYMIMSLAITIIFVIVFSTLTILEKLDNT
jgi:hypothetical protein